MENTTDEPGSLLAEMRGGFRGMRAIRASKREDSAQRAPQRKALERDLAGYTSPADLNELDAILERYSEEETADIRRILTARRAA